jgi:hypothetical protein
VCAAKRYYSATIETGRHRPSTSTTGAIGELVAGADLLRRGYEVFRGLSPACSCDLIASKGGRRPLRVEVRTGWRNAKTGTLSYSKRPADDNKCDHYCVVVNYGEEVIYVPPLATELLPDRVAARMPG